MDAYFRRADDSEYHINVGRTYADAVTPIPREASALSDVKRTGASVTFEGYGRDCDYRSKKSTYNQK